MKYIILLLSIVFVLWLIIYVFVFDSYRTMDSLSYISQIRHKWSNNEQSLTLQSDNIQISTDLWSTWTTNTSWGSIHESLSTKDLVQAWSHTSSSNTVLWSGDKISSASTATSSSSLPSQINTPTIQIETPLERQSQDLVDSEREDIQRLINDLLE